MDQWPGNSCLSLPVVVLPKFISVTLIYCVNIPSFMVFSSRVIAARLPVNYFLSSRCRFSFGSRDHMVPCVLLQFDVGHEIDLYEL